MNPQVSIHFRLCSDFRRLGMKEHVKILVLGDSGVGKSSLISSYVSNYFSYDVPSIVADCFLRSDTTASGVSVTIMDSSARPGDRNVLIQKIRVSDSIIACYDTTRLETIDNLATIWLPLIQAERNGQAKVVVAGTKIDLLGEPEDVIPAEEEKRVQELLMPFPFCLLAERSSSKLLNISSVFRRAEQVVTYPISPVYNIREKKFTSNGLRALLHVYRVYDWDGDNLLSDTELNRLHAECFNSSFSQEELVEFKRQLPRFTSNGILQNKVTFEGLLASIKRFISGCQSVIQLWAMLRRFDYDDDLSLQVCSNHYSSIRTCAYLIHTQLPSDLDWVSTNSDSTRLTPDAIEFLIKLYTNAVYHVKSNDPRSESYPDCDLETYLGNFMSMEGKSDAEATYFKAIAFILSVIMPDVSTPWKSFPIYEVRRESATLSELKC
jgi:small GTP-binding protein